MKTYRDLRAWEGAMDLCRFVYKLTEEFPRAEQFGLTSQIRRSAISLPSNIAEGHARDSTGDYLRHLSITQGSIAELETQLILSRDFDYLDDDTLCSALELTDGVGKMVRGLQKSLRKKISSS